MSTEIKQAKGYSEYHAILIYHYDILTLKYRDFITQKARLTYDDDIFTEYLSEAITILSLILPKLKGGGKRTENLYERIKRFEPWISDILIPRVTKQEEVFELHTLLGEAYELLGLSDI